MAGYYVYAHLRLDTGKVFYIGKGKSNRAYSKHGRNNFWKAIVNKYGYRVEIVANNLTEKDSFNKEIELISYYKDLGQCEANLTLGGDNPPSWKGKTFTVEHRKNLANNHKGYKLSQEQKRKIGTFHSKPVVDISTGFVWDSCKEAAETYGMNPTTLSNKLCGRKNNNTNLRYINE